MSGELAPEEVAFKEGKLSRDEVNEIISLIEGALKTMAPTTISDLMNYTLGSEKLAEIMVEYAASEAADEAGRLLCLFVLIEVAPERAIKLMRDGRASGGSRWLTGAIVQRLYAYYTSRPLPEGIKAAFEGLLVDLELELEGSSAKGGIRGAALESIRKKAFKDTTDNGSAKP